MKMTHFKKICFYRDKKKVIKNVMFDIGRQILNKNDMQFIQI